MDEIAQADNDADGDVILSILFHGSKCGFAAFHCASAELFVGEFYEGEDLGLTRLLLDQVNPSTVLVLLSNLHGNLQQLIANRSGRIESVKLGEFALERAHKRLLTLCIGGMLNLSSDARMVQLGSVFNLQNQTMIRAVGALLGFIEHSEGLQHTAEGLHMISAVKELIIDGCLQVDRNTLVSLQVFHADEHPSAQGIGRAKEGLSVYGLLDRTRSRPGKRLLRTWLMRPLVALPVLRERHALVAYLLDPKQAEFVLSTAKLLAEVADVKRILCRLQRMSASFSDWLQLFDTISSVVELKTAAMLQSQDHPLLARMANLSNDVEALLHLLLSTVDWDESKLRANLTVRAGIHEELDEYRQNYDGLDDFLTVIAREELTELANHESDITELNVVYYPQIGYLIAISAFQMGDRADVASLRFQFRTAENIYFTNRRMELLNSRLGDLHALIADLQTSIIRELASKVLEFTSSLLEISDVCGEFDCLLCFAIVAQENGWHCPELVEESIFTIKNGRHPLQELCVPVFIPNDALASQSSARIQLITGPNASGKSVYLKQVALIVYLAHIGSFVPADSARIGIVDRIFSRLRSDETTSLNYSAFMLDLHQLAIMLRASTKRSLLIVDEFGKGTAASGTRPVFMTIRRNRSRCCCSEAPSPLRTGVPYHIF
eukprot:TRINITY_DN751_c0_g1_i9.p1 TRINITY_DN751_c0_g1~~TRINITY_DN751_c0_g1_i9.p1  ORF type:complete len:665 (-),score=83.81 TRINITY_DN751_c0_g1_i9:1097-3091(-)